MTIDQVGRRTSVHPLLGGRPGDVALFCGSVSVTYGNLSARVDARRAELGPTRRLVFLEAGNDIESVAFNPGNPLQRDGVLTRARISQHIGETPVVLCNGDRDQRR